jgi:hypothetical protein
MKATKLTEKKLREMVRGILKESEISPGGVFDRAKESSREPLKSKFVYPPDHNVEFLGSATEEGMVWRIRDEELTSEEFISRIKFIERSFRTGDQMFRNNGHYMERSK